MLDDLAVQELNLLFGLKQQAPVGRKSRHAAPDDWVIGACLIIPINSSRKLASEGWNMQHCVTDYQDGWAKGWYRIFSLRDLKGNRLATLLLTYCAQVDGWRIDQCVGFRNEEVDTNELGEPTDLLLVAREVTKLLNSKKNDSWNARSDI
jgi:hypothetical protein